MSLRNVLESEILIRLTENGFVETIRCFGRESSFAYDVIESTPVEEAKNERLFAPVLVKRNENRGTGNAS